MVHSVFENLEKIDVCELNKHTQSEEIELQRKIDVVLWGKAIEEEKKFERMNKMKKKNIIRSTINSTKMNKIRN